MNKEEFIKKYAKVVNEGYAAIFAGAGTSVGAGFIDWKTLVKPFADYLGLGINYEQDLVRIAQYFRNAKGTRAAINQAIKNEFSSNENETETLEILTRLPIYTYWTTNYDTLIEDSLKKNNRKADVKIKEENLATNIYDRDAVVYKMHGDISLPHEAVITKDDYELYNETRSLFTTSLKGDLISKTFLFLGFSFEDPNLDGILGRIKFLLEENTRDHYCIFKKISLEDYEDSDSKIAKKKFENDKIRQKLRMNDLKRYGIETILVDSYNEIPMILTEIENIYLNKSIFISGSISGYNSIWTKKDVNEFCYVLSKKFIAKDYKVLSGFGLGIGSNVINGALDEIYAHRYKHVNEHLGLHPFPQSDIGEISLKERWTQYRRDIIAEAGICIFIFGNKESDGKIVSADGMKEEFEIARDMNKVIIPVGGTGEITREIFKLMKQEKKKYEYLGRYWDLLESTDKESLLKTIISIVDSKQN